MRAHGVVGLACGQARPISHQAEGARASRPAIQDFPERGSSLMTRLQPLPGTVTALPVVFVPTTTARRAGIGRIHCRSITGQQHQRRAIEDQLPHRCQSGE